MGLAMTLAVAVLALGGGAQARAHPVVFGTEASNKRLAEKEATRELRSLRVPPGAHRVDSSPAPILDEWVESRGGGTNRVSRWEWLVAPGTVQGTLRWFLAHPPAGSRTDGRRGGVGGREAAVTLWFEVPERSRRVEGPSVVPAVTALPGHRVGIRLEVQQVWKKPHPAAARIPAASRVLDVSRESDGVEGTRWQAIRSPRRVHQVARMIDRLPALQPQFISCPEVFGEHVRVTLRFKAREGGPLLAEATERMPEGCGSSMELTVRGDPRTFFLEDGARVIRFLDG